MSKDLHIASLLDVYGYFLNEKQRLLTEHYYNDDLSLSEIAENEGITRQGVRDQIKRAEQTLLSLEEKCRYYELFKRLKELVSYLKKGDASAINEIINIIEEL